MPGLGLICIRALSLLLQSPRRIDQFTDRNDFKSRGSQPWQFALQNLQCRCVWMRNRDGVTALPGHCLEALQFELNRFWRRIRIQKNVSFQRCHAGFRRDSQGNAFVGRIAVY